LDTTGSTPTVVGVFSVRAYVTVHYQIYKKFKLDPEYAFRQ
jgi:hypothetical protein